MPQDTPNEKPGANPGAPETKIDRIREILERSAERMLGAGAPRMIPSCVTVTRDLVAYVKKELKPSRCSQIEQHLEACRACQTELAAVRETLGLATVEDTPRIVRVVNSILAVAISQKASDIHIEPQRENVRVRYRIDGVLHEVMTLPVHIQEPLLRRIKVMADLNIAESNRPQDGRFHIRHTGRDFDLRVSTFPFQYGEKIVARILSKNVELLKLDDLELSAEQTVAARSLLHRSHGLLLTAGPAGCGKTTIAYALLSALDLDSVLAVTIEDPVEYRIEGVPQVWANRAAGLDWPTAIRRFARNDPDVMLVGEIDNKATAEAVCDVASTGHLVISTAIANDAATAIARLLRLGVGPAILATTLLGVISSRLLRQVCPDCATNDDPPPKELAALGHSFSSGTFRKGTGCAACRGTGYRGRICAFEVLTVNETMVKAIAADVDGAALFRAACESGMEPLVRTAARLATEGMTTVTEALRVTRDLCDLHGGDQDA